MICNAPTGMHLKVTANALINGTVQYNIINPRPITTRRT